MCNSAVRLPRHSLIDGWKTTSHSQATARNLSTSFMGQSCMECHATGFDSTEWADDFGFLFPTPSATAYDSIVTNHPEQATLFNIQCETCHGPQGHGDGPIGEALDPKPQNLAELQAVATEDYLFWRIAEGKPGTSMPPWKNILTEEQEVEIIRVPGDYEAAVERSRELYPARPRADRRPRHHPGRLPGERGSGHRARTR